MNLPRALLVLVLAAAGCAAGARPVARSQPRAAVDPAESSAEPEILVRRPPSSTGALDGDEAGWAIFGRSAELGACYAGAGGGLAGRGVVYVLLDVEPAGTVERVTIGHSDIRGARFEGCLRDALSGLALPSSGRRALVQTHLVFGARDRDDGRALLRAYRTARAGGGAPHAARGEAAVSLTSLRGRIQTCYERRLRGRPDLRGRMMLELTVEVDGQISRAAVTEQALDDRLSRCVLGAVRNVRLQGEYASSAILQYPVILEPGR
jgi:hypothetical protein